MNCQAVVSVFSQFPRQQTNPFDEVAFDSLVYAGKKLANRGAEQKFVSQQRL